MTGVVDDAIDMVETLRRADTVSLKFRSEVGLDGGGEERAYGDAQAIAYDGPQVSGFELSDVDRLLREHEQRGWHAGYQRGCSDVGEALTKAHEVQLGEYVAGAFDVVGRELLSSIVTAAVKVHREKGSTRQGIVDAVVAAVKREARGLDDVAARARRGELFS